MIKVVQYDILFHLIQDVFKAMGCSAEHARVGASTLISADLRGIDSHGLARLSGYVRLWEAGRINATPHITISYQTPSTAVVDGDGGLGLVVAPFAMEVAIQKASAVGSGWVSVKNSNHFGIAAYHAMMALENDMIGMAMTNASALVAPTFSKERMLGTNPICVAVPGGQEAPFVADLATTTAANGKLEILQRKGTAAPDGWIQDVDGIGTNDSHALKNGGSLLPLGGDRDHGSHKGYALGSIVDIFSGVLSGANFGPWVPPFPAYVPMPENQPGKGLGHFLGAMRIDAFRPADEFKRDMDLWITRFKSAKPIDPNVPVVIPGEPEAQMEILRKKDGIPLLEVVWDDLVTTADKFGIKL